MKPFTLHTGIVSYDTFAAFAEEFRPGPQDLILTNAYIFRPGIESLQLGTQVLFQEEYGAGEPTDAMVDAMLSDLESRQFDRIIAVGGGTVIDIAKVIAAAGRCDRCDDLYDRGAESLVQMHPLTVVPTTCGTGSEVTNISIINRISRGVKMGLTGTALYAQTAVLIPELLASLPHFVFATSSIDAMIHATESYLSPNACDLSRLFSVAALEKIIGCWKRTREFGAQENWKQYAQEFLTASNWAGIAFGYGGCAAVHATSYPLGSVHHIPHGQANQFMFRAVLEKYKILRPVGKINEYEALLAGILGCDQASALEELYALMDWILPKDPLREHGVTREELPVFADNVIDTQQRLLRNNYIPLTRDQILEIYESAF